MVEIKEEAYEKLRTLCLSEPLRGDYPDWPRPFLFQGQEITRDIFFLDPALEYTVIELGKNPIRDASYFRYRRLDLWFHYRFFNGWNPVAHSAESLTLGANSRTCSSKLFPTGILGC